MTLQATPAYVYILIDQEQYACLDLNQIKMIKDTVGRDNCNHQRSLAFICRVVQGQAESKHENQLTGTEHMVIIVTNDYGTKWLTDVGFGGQVARHPVRLDIHPLHQPKDEDSKGMLVCYAMPCHVICTGGYRPHI